MTDPVIIGKWHALVEQCDAKVAACMADPQNAALEGIAPAYEGGASEFVTFGGYRDKQVQNDTAAWLRAVARELIDDSIWNYKVVEAMGGTAYLALISVNETGYRFGEDDE